MTNVKLKQQCTASTLGYYLQLQLDLQLVLSQTQPPPKLCVFTVHFAHVYMLI